MKICTRCHKEFQEGRFCLECGGELKEQTSLQKEKNTGTSLGDKNVVAGDIIGQKEEYKITGNSTFIKNEDETRKIINCNVCGKNEMIIDSVRCPSCLTSVCKDHFNYKTNRCTNCEKNAESEYKALLGQVLEDGKIDQNERIILNNRAGQYKISAERALEIENEYKSQSKKLDSQSLNAFDKIELKKIRKEIANLNDLVPIFERIGRLYSKYSNNEEIKKLYYQIGPHALGAFQDKLSQNFDEFYAEIAKIDIEILKNKDLPSAIDKLDLVKQLYPERELDINAKELDIFYRLYEIEGDDYVEPIEDLLESILAKNWHESDYAGFILFKIFNDKKIVFQNESINSWGENLNSFSFDENILVQLELRSNKSSIIEKQTIKTITSIEIKEPLIESSKKDIPDPVVSETTNNTFNESKEIVVPSKKEKEEKIEIVEDVLVVKDENSFPELIDEDDNCIQIGTQIWMKKNLDVDHYRNGDPIPEIKDGKVWNCLITGAWCYYEFDSENGKKYGKLYNWYAVNDPRGLAPKGWHIPSDKEWTLLANQLGGDSIAGMKMYSANDGWCFWPEGSKGFLELSKCVNESGFAALPSGFLSCEGIDDASFYEDCSSWWASSSVSSECADSISINTDNPYQLNMDWNTYQKNDGFSVRCVKNIEKKSDKDLNKNTKVTAAKKSDTTKSKKDETKKAKAVSYKELISKHFKSINYSKTEIFEKINLKKLNAFSLKFDQTFWKKSTVLLYSDKTIFGKGDEGFAIVEYEKNLLLLYKESFADPEIYQLNHLPNIKYNLLLEVKEKKTDYYIFMYRKADGKDILESKKILALNSSLFITALNKLLFELK